MVVSYAWYSAANDAALPHGFADRLRDIGATCNDTAAALLQAEAWEFAATQNQDDHESTPGGPPPYRTRFASQLADISYRVTADLTRLYTQYTTVYAYTAAALHAPDIASAPIVADPASAPQPGQLMSDVDGWLPAVDPDNRGISAEDAVEIAASRATIVDAVERFRCSGGSRLAFDDVSAPPSGEADVDLPTDIASALHRYAAALVAAFEHQTR